MQALLLTWEELTDFTEQFRIEDRIWQKNFKPYLVESYFIDHVYKHKKTHMNVKSNF